MRGPQSLGRQEVQVNGQWFPLLPSFAHAALLLASLLSGATAMGQVRTDLPAPLAAAARAEDATDAALYVMRSEKFSLKEIKAADAAMYLHRLEAEAAVERGRAAHAEARIQQAQLSAQSLANDLEVRKDLFVAQARYNVAIFVMVFAIVAGGLWFSFLQFTAERRAGDDLASVIREIAKLAPDDPLRAVLAFRIEAMGRHSTQSFEAGPIKMSSNVIGLVILAMSLAFYYLYLDRVYPIQINSGGTTVDAKQTLADTLRKAAGEGSAETPAK